VSRLIAIGDIHGCCRTFQSLITAIDLKKNDRLILLGDYVDRGDQIRELIDLIIDLRDKGFLITPLKGNHEDMLIESVTDPEMFFLWKMNHGRSTLESFGVPDAGHLDNKYLGFFRSLPEYIAVGNILFVHAGFNDYIDDPFSDTQSMLWESNPQYMHPLLRDRIIVHGHRPKQVEFVQAQIRNQSHVIPIDTGCVYGKDEGYGFLSALELNSFKLTSVPRQ
jgi:serine/threonine protein phosphatase 1